jgi:hypothetical protein
VQLAASQEGLSSMKLVQKAERVAVIGFLSKVSHTNIYGVGEEKYSSLESEAISLYLLATCSVFHTVRCARVELCFGQ